MFIIVMWATFILIGCIAAASLIAAAEELPANAEPQADMKRQTGSSAIGAESLK